mgnify:CR=1 FL=1
MPRITRPLPDGPARKRPPAALRWGVVLLVAAALGAVAGVAVDRLSDPVYSAVARIALEPDAYRPAEGGDDAILMPRLRGKLARIAGDDVLAAASPAPADLRSRVAVHSPQGELTADIVVQAASADAAAGFFAFPAPAVAGLAASVFGARTSPSAAVSVVSRSIRIRLPVSRFSA